MSQAEEIKNRIDVVDLVGSYVRLQKAGSNFKARCPFHNEKTPSFNVSPARQIWHCFGCGKGGDIIEFVKEIEGFEFYEALKLLADRAGIELRSEDNGERNERARMLAVMEEAAKFYERNLSSDAGLAALNYLRNRKLKEETIKEFRIGYAEQEWKSLFTSLLGKGFKAEEIERAGLTVKSQNSKFTSQNYYDRFRGRVIFPIFDHGGRVVAFSGRIYPDRDNEAKYINSPETSVYQKGKILFGLNKSKTEILRESECVLVEGNMDMIMSWQAGVRNVAAISGTALTKDHLKTLSRICEKVLLSFDLDSAGVAANKRGVDLLKSALSESLEFDLRIVELKGFKDAADAAARDPQIWQDAVKNSINIARYYIDNSLKKHSPDTPEAKKEFQKNVLPLVASLNTLEQAHWVKVISDTLRVREEAVWSAISKITAPPARTESRAELNNGAKTLPAPAGRRGLLESKILSIVAQYPMLGGKLEPGLEHLLKTEATAAVFAELFLSGAIEAEAELVQCQRELKKEYLKERAGILLKSIREAEKTGQKTEELLSEFQKISSELSKM